MELSMATDYASDTGNAEPSLRRIAAAGFEHIQWIHHWGHDFIYTAPEIQYISEVMAELDLCLYDIHAPAGAEKNWFSTVEYQRRAGVEIIKNRVEMCRTLGGEVIVAHIPDLNLGNLKAWDQLQKSLDELETFCAKQHIRIAVENRAHDEFAGIKELFSEYAPEFIGLCYDSGHGNIGGEGLTHLESVSDRLISIHLHDNDGKSDLHKLLFTGTVDWRRLAGIISDSPYRRYLTLESNMRHSEYTDEDLFLEAAFASGRRLQDMI